MSNHADKTSDTKNQAVVTGLPEAQNTEGPTLQLVDNRPQTIAQRKLQEGMNNSPRTQQAAQLQAKADQHVALQSQPIQRKENKTGLPDQLKAGIENLSGITMDDVKVHRNSDKPAALQAHAYAQGTDIHLAPGQEQHLPHEAWHVVQQKQGRVKPTMQLKGRVDVNDDEGLELEADVMGSKALQLRRTMASESLSNGSSTGTTVQRALKAGKLNVVGEDHEKSGGAAKRLSEENYSKAEVGGEYWLENTFPASQDAADKDKPADTYLLQNYFVLATIKQYNDLMAQTEKRPKEIVRNWCDNMLDQCKEIIKMAPKAKAINEAGAVAWYDRHENKILEMRDVLELAAEVGLSPAGQIAEILGSFGVIPNRLDASMARGLAMHVAANKGAQAGVIGVWKVGQQHIDEITAKTLPGDRQYTLTNANTFYEGYDAWIIAKAEKNKAAELAAAAIAAKLAVPDVDLSKHPDPSKTMPIISAAEVDAADDEHF